MDIRCGEWGGRGAIAVLRLKEWVNKEDKDSRQKERDRIGEIIYIYNTNKMGDIRFEKINGRYTTPKITVKFIYERSWYCKALYWLGGSG